MRRAEDLRAAAKRAGLRVESIEFIPTIDGEVTIASRMVSDDPWAAARFLDDDELARIDAADPVVREYALAILSACRDQRGEPGPTRSPELLACTAQAIQANVQHAIGFVHEGTETFQSARETLRMGNGDCDDHAYLVKVLGLAANLPAELSFFEEDGQPVHVTPKLLGEWAETTIGAEFGEHPYDALARLELETGENPMAHATLAALISTPDAARARKQEIDRIALALDVAILACGGGTPGETDFGATDLAAWQSWLVGWESFMARAVSIVDAGQQLEQADAYAAELAQWQSTAAAHGCGKAVPQVTPTTEKPGADWTGTIKVVAIGIAVVAGALAIREVTKVVPRARTNPRRRKRAA